MIKGAKKQMIVLRTSASRYFDEAYFVLRHESAKEACRDDILREANRILEENTPERQHSVRKTRWLFFALGAGVGGLLASLGACLAMLL